MTKNRKIGLWGGILTGVYALISAMAIVGLICFYFWQIVNYELMILAAVLFIAGKRNTLLYVAFAGSALFYFFDVVGQLINVAEFGSFSSRNFIWSAVLLAIFCLYACSMRVQNRRKRKTLLIVSVVLSSIILAHKASNITIVSGDSTWFVWLALDLLFPVGLALEAFALFGTDEPISRAKNKQRAVASGPAFRAESPAIIQPQGKLEAQPDNQPERKPEAQPDNQPERKPEAQTDNQSENKPEAQPDNQPERKPEAQPDNQFEDKPEARPDVQPESKPAVQPECAQATAPRSTDAVPYDELMMLKDLADQGVITQEEFTAKKKQLLGL